MDRILQWGGRRQSAEAADWAGGPYDFDLRHHEKFAHLGDLYGSRRHRRKCDWNFHRQQPWSYADSVVYDSGSTAYRTVGTGNHCPVAVCPGGGAGAGAVAGCGGSDVVAAATADAATLIAREGALEN